MSKVTCPKCQGTGFVEGFAHVKNGVCFDCDGTGSIETTTVPRSGRMTPRKWAAAVGDAVLAGEPVEEEQVVQAFEIFEDIAPMQWSTKDYDRRNAMGRRIGRVI